MSRPQRNPSYSLQSLHQTSEAPGSGSSSSDSVGLAPSGAEFSDEERILLLRLAHDAILSAFEHRNLSLDPPTPHLGELRGAFTSLYLREALRGCVGYVMPVSPVYRTVAETARAAAFEDNRFQLVTLEEATELAVELSILSPPRPVRAEEVEVGRHGLLISMAGHRGLLLPQVPLEHGWSLTAFLEQTCRKAGLPLDAWQRGATIEAFTAEIFGDKDAPRCSGGRG